MARVPALSLVCRVLLAAVPGIASAADSATGAVQAVPAGAVAPAAAAATSPAAADASATAAGASASPAAAASVYSPEEAKIRDDVSYFAGRQMAGGVEHNDLNPEEVLRGLQDELGGKAPPIDQAKISAEINQYKQNLTAHLNAAAAAHKADFDKNNPNWLATVAKKKGVVPTGSGLLYEVKASGTGRQPTPEDVVAVNYKGMLPDGTVFDASPPGHPVTFQLNKVIKGWTEAVALMKEGDKWTVYIPAELAYGSNPPPGSIIPADSPLVFDIELIKVLPPDGGGAGGGGGGGGAP